MPFVFSAKSLMQGTNSTYTNSWRKSASAMPSGGRGFAPETKGFGFAWREEKGKSVQIYEFGWKK
jgi:hypothetical protein